MLETSSPQKILLKKESKKKEEKNPWSWLNMPRDLKMGAKHDIQFPPCVKHGKVFSFAFLSTSLHGKCFCCGGTSPLPPPKIFEKGGKGGGVEIFTIWSRFGNYHKKTNHHLGDILVFEKTKSPCELDFGDYHKKTNHHLR